MLPVLSLDTVRTGYKSNKSNHYLVFLSSEACYWCTTIPYCPLLLSLLLIVTSNPNLNDSSVKHCIFHLELVNEKKYYKLEYSCCLPCFMTTLF